MQFWLTLMLGWVDMLRRLWLRLRGVRSCRVDTSQGSVHYWEMSGRGSLPPVLLVHGLSSMAGDWWPVMARLRPHCRCVRALDLPGHGDSDVPHFGMNDEGMRNMLSEVLPVVLDEPHIVIGNSLGGLVSVRMAQWAPEQVERLVLISPAGARIDVSEFESVLELFAIDSVRSARRFVRALFASWVPFQWIVSLGVWARVTRPAVREVIENFSEENLLDEQELSSLQMPVLLFWGKEDDILGANHLAYFQSHLPPHAQIYTPSKMGHSPFIAAPGRFLAPILSFCRGESLPSS